MNMTGSYIIPVNMAHPLSYFVYEDSQPCC